MNFEHATIMSINSLDVKIGDCECRAFSGQKLKMEKKLKQTTSK